MGKVRTNIRLEDEFVRTVMERYHLETKTEAVDLALRHLAGLPRAEGVTPPGMLDCMIAAVAWRRRASLLAWDADMDRVARVMGIQMDRASLHVSRRRAAPG